MARIEEYNLNIGDLINRLGTSARPAKVECYEIKAIYRRKGTSGWQLHTAQLIPVEQKNEDSVQNYGEEAFVCIYRNLGGPKYLLQQLGGKGEDDSGIIEVPNYPPIRANHSGWREYLIPSHASPYNVPLRHYQFAIECSHWPDNPLIAHGLTYYSSFEKRAAEFIQHYSNVTRSNAIHILVLDNRGSLLVKDNKVKVIAPEDCDLVGQKQSFDEISKIGGTPSSGLFDIKDAIALEMWLINNSGMVYDYISSSARHCRYKVMSDERQYNTLVERDIEAGEGFHIEYKKYIDLTKGDSKENEIVHTVCAFSNSNGGRLIIGVADDLTLTGISGYVRKTYKAPISEALASYRKDLNSLLYEGLTTTNCFEVKTIQIRTKYLAVIDVSGGHQWNFVRNTDIPYLRKGASNMSATRILAMELNNQRSIA